MIAPQPWRPVSFPLLPAVKRAAFLVLSGGLLVFGADAIGIRWDPFGQERRRLYLAEARATHAERDAAARAAEARGERQQARRLEQTLQTVRAAETLTSTAVQAARTDDDAEILLVPERAARLRAHDDELCRLAPHLAGCAAAPEPS